MGDPSSHEPLSSLPLFAGAASTFLRTASQAYTKPGSLVHLSTLTSYGSPWFQVGNLSLALPADARD